MPQIEIADIARIKLEPDEILLVRVDTKGTISKLNAASHAFVSCGIPPNRLIITDKATEVVAIRKPEG